MPLRARISFLLILLPFALGAAEIQGFASYSIWTTGPSTFLNVTKIDIGAFGPAIYDFDDYGPVVDGRRRWSKVTDFGEALHSLVEMRWITLPGGAVPLDSHWVDSGWLRVENPTSSVQVFSFDYAVHSYALALGPDTASMSVYAAFEQRRVSSTPWMPVPELTFASSVSTGESDYACSPACTGTYAIDIGPGSYTDIRLYTRLDYSAVEAEAAVPEPAAFWLVGALLLGAAQWRGVRTWRLRGMGQRR